ncbi:UNVERIFIED_CONTAM: hypothetical protein RMT77_016896 [Armadillidium vulgare]
MNGMKRLLFIGTSEVATLDRMKEQLQQIYEVELFVSLHPGVNLLTLGRHLATFLKSNGPVDQIYIFGLTCSIWKKVSLTIDKESVNVLTWDSACNLSFVPIQMNAIVSLAVRSNPAVKVYLVIPTMKDIASFNEAYLKRQGWDDLIPSLEEHPHFQRAFLNKKAQEMFEQTVELQGNNLPWVQKRTFSMKTVFDRYYNNKCQGNPHHRFWMGESDRLDALDLSYDGLHYTATAFEEMFAFLSLNNFNKRAQENRPVTTIATPTTTTTTSVVVEEVKSTPGPSGIQGRLEYRKTSPHQPRTVPSTPKMRTKGKLENRLFYSRSFVDSMGMGELPSTSSKSSHHDGVNVDNKRGSFTDCPLRTSKPEKNFPKNTLPTSTTASTSKRKVKGLQRFDKRRKMRLQSAKLEGFSKSTGNNTTTSPSTMSPEFITFIAVQASKLWSFAKEQNIPKEVALKEFNRAF